MDKKPPNIVSTLDFERLDSLLNLLRGSDFPGEGYLRAELDRAELIDPQHMPPTVITMNSIVRFAVEAGEFHR